MKDVEWEAPDATRVGVGFQDRPSAPAAAAAGERGASVVGDEDIRNDVGEDMGAEDVYAGLASEIIGVWTFGSPRVGDADFAANYGAALGTRTWRVTHSHDIVPSVPVRIMGYHHVPTEVFYDADGADPPTAGSYNPFTFFLFNHQAKRHSIFRSLFYAALPRLDSTCLFGDVKVSRVNAPKGVTLYSSGPNMCTGTLRVRPCPAVCDDSGEDVRCSDGEWTHTSIIDHLYYLNTYICGCNI